MKVNVNVTQKDIDNGMDNNGFLCPISLALRRRINNRSFVPSTKKSLIRIYRGHWTNPHCQLVAMPPDVVLPEKATKFINKFDEHETVKPFSFSIDIPKKYLKKRKKP